MFSLLQEISSNPQREQEISFPPNQLWEGRRIQKFGHNITTVFSILIIFSLMTQHNNSVLCYLMYIFCNSAWCSRMPCLHMTMLLVYKYLCTIHQSWQSHYDLVQKIIISLFLSNDNATNCSKRRSPHASTLETKKLLLMGRAEPW